MTWLVVVVVGVGSYALRALGLFAGASGRMSPGLQDLAEDATAALLAAVILTAAFVTAGRIDIDPARTIGVLVAATAAWLRLPFLVIFLAGIAAAAVSRGLMGL